MEKEVPKEGKLIGEVTHYFGRIEVAIIKLSGNLETDDLIQITGGGTDFQQKVKSMEIEHQKVKRAKAKQVIGLRVDQKVKEGYKVYKL
jgi:putative protease